MIENGIGFQVPVHLIIANRSFKVTHQAYDVLLQMDGIFTLLLELVLGHEDVKYVF